MCLPMDVSPLCLNMAIWLCSKFLYHRHLQQQNLDFQHFFVSTSSSIFLRTRLTSGKTVALDLAIEEFQPDPSNADKMRNLSRGLTRFRTERENKGVHGRSFRGGFSSFAASGQKGTQSDIRLRDVFTDYSSKSRCRWIPVTTISVL